MCRDCRRAPVCLLKREECGLRVKHKVVRGMQFVSVKRRVRGSPVSPTLHLSFVQLQAKV